MMKIRVLMMAVMAILMTGLFSAPSQAQSEEEAERRLERYQQELEGDPRYYTDENTTDVVEVGGVVTTPQGKVVSRHREVYRDGKFQRRYEGGPGQTMKQVARREMKEGWERDGMSPRGCQRAWITFKKYSSIANDRLFTYKVGQRWCWRASTQTTSVKKRWSDWSIQSPNTIEWKGYVHKKGKYFQSSLASKNRPKSGVFTDRRAKFRNCFDSHCTGTFYPRNALWGYWNGAYKWRYGDDW